MASSIYSAFEKVVVPFGASIVGNYEKIDFAYNFAQALATRKVSRTPSFFSKLERFEEYLWIADIGSLLATTSLAAYKAEEKYALVSRATRFLASPTVLDVWIFTTSVGLVSSIAIGILSVYLIDKFYKPSSSFDSSILSNNFSFNRPFNEKIKQFLYVSRVVINIALAVLCPLNPIFVLSAALEIYSLVKLTQRKWIEFKKTSFYAVLDTAGALIADKICITYSFLMKDVHLAQSTMDLEAKDSCTICLDEELPCDAYFCDKHVFHAGCLVPMVEHKSQSFGQGFRFKGREILETRHYGNYGYTGSTYSAIYKINAPDHNIPSCPICREKPTFNQFNVRVHDLRYGWSSARVNWLPT